MTTPASGSAVLARFAQELAQVTPPPADERRLVELQRLVFVLPEEELPQALELLRTASAQEALGSVASAIGARWAETNPHEALQRAEKLPLSLRTSVAQGALQVWARRDFDAAFAWTCARPDGEERNTQLDTVYNDLMKRDPASALARLKEVPSEAKRKQFRIWTFEMWRHSDPDAAIAWINANEPEETRDGQLKEFISSWATYRPDLCVDYSLRHMSNPHQREESIRFALMQWGSHDPAGAIAALVSLPEEMQTPNLARNAAPFIATGDVDSLLDATRKLPAGDFRDAIQASAAARIANTDLNQARAILDGLQSADSRRQAAMAIAHQWLRQDPQAARQWIESSRDLSTDLKKQIINENQNKR